MHRAHAAGPVRIFPGGKKADARTPRTLRLANSLGFSLVDGATSSGVLEANRSIEETEFVRFISEDCHFAPDEQVRILPNTRA